MQKAFLGHGRVSIRKTWCTSLNHQGRLTPYFGARYAFVMATHQEFWARQPGLVWSNRQAGDEIWIRAALLNPRFTRLLEIAVEFGLERLCEEWAILKEEGTPEALRARGPVERILSNIGKGFSSAFEND
ncbi:MAG TPA: hypothetical protein VMZ27_11970 [Candidatus Saccharimonadales bacterium]|nr:hypothetical protein [Candidatus Saccharimonadales bacterium]